MKVLFVISGLGPGTAGRQIILLSKELVRAGHAVSIYALGRQTAPVEELAGVPVTVIVDDKRRRLDAGVLWRLRRHIRSWRPDIVHGVQCDGDIYSRLASWGAPVQVLNSERSDDPGVSLVQRIGYGLTSHLCDGIVANSCAGAAFAASLHRMREDQVDVVWNAVELHEIDARVMRSNAPARQEFPGAQLKRVCMVASIKPQNDYPLALRVLRRLVDHDPLWRLICIGDEPRELRGYKASVLAERDRLQLEPFVKFLGHRRDVLEHIASGDVLLLTALQGGFPNVALEAMACGTPVVSTDYGDVRRLLPVPGQVAGSRAEGDIAEAILSCHGRRAEIAKAQRRWVEQHATAAAGAAALLAVYAKYLLPPAIPVQPQ